MNIFKTIGIVILLSLSTLAHSANYADTDQLYMWDGTQYNPTVTEHKAWLGTFMYTKAEADAADAADDTAYDSLSWDGNTDAATKNAIRDKIETMGSAGTSNIDDGTIDGQLAKWNTVTGKYEPFAPSNFEDSLEAVFPQAIRVDDTLILPTGSAPTEVATLPGTLVDGTLYAAIDTGDMTHKSATGTYTFAGTYVVDEEPVAVTCSTVKDSLVGTAEGSTYFADGTYPYMGSPAVVASSYTLCAVDVFIGKVGTPTGSLTLELRDYTTKTVLATSTTTIIEASVNTTETQVKFEGFDYAVTAGSYYYTLHSSTDGEFANRYFIYHMNGPDEDFIKSTDGSTFVDGLSSKAMKFINYAE